VTADRSSRRWWLLGVAVAAVVVLAASFWASADPDGLNRIAADLGFDTLAQDAPFELLPGYSVPGLDGPLSKILAGLIGMLIVFGLVYGIGRLLIRRRAA
jgi:cobalt/nickel transport system permease protein